VTNSLSSRASHEIEHGKKLSMGHPEDIWGWGSPAGQLRAKRRAAIIARGAGLRPGMRALEIGCGTGNFTEMFALHGAHLIAVDISPELLEEARRRNLPPDRVQFVERRFEDCNIDGPFDAVIGSSVLHHLDMDEAMPRILTLLKPGGVISFAEPNMMNPQILVQKNVPWVKERLGDSPDETAFVRWQFARQLRRAGYTDIFIRPFDWLHPATPAPMIGSIRGLGRILERVPLVQEFAGSLFIRARAPSILSLSR
jgi:SAM-dependent methyltransferase